MKELTNIETNSVGGGKVNINQEYVQEVRDFLETIVFVIDAIYFNDINPDRLNHFKNHQSTDCKLK
ncbi:MAG: hypothetical protein ACHQJ6_00840 [Candidatus Berkiellales bacterium]